MQSVIDFLEGFVDFIALIILYSTVFIIMFALYMIVSPILAIMTALELAKKVVTDDKTEEKG